MTEQRPVLEIRFDGEAVGPGRISLAHLSLFLPNLNNALQRVGRVLQGNSESLPKRWPSRRVTSELDLELVSLRQGSPAVVLGFERKTAESLIPELDFGHKIVETALDGLNAIQESEAEEALPTGYDPSVLTAWCDAGRVFKLGISKVSIAFNGREPGLRASLTSDGIVQMRNRIKGHQVSVRTIEGRLLMADFKEQGMQCRVYPSVGKPITCLFDESQREAVIDNILQFIRIKGEAAEDPFSGRISKMKIHHIESLENQPEDDISVLSRGNRFSQEFWKSPTLEELAHSQNVGPITDVTLLFGTWPGEDDDEFEAAIDDLRHRDLEQIEQS